MLIGFYFVTLIYCLKIKWTDASGEDDFFTSIDDLKGHFEGLI